MLDKCGDDLDKLQSELEEAERKLAVQTRKKKWAQDDLSLTEKAGKDIEQIVSSYIKAWDSMRKSSNELNDYYDTKSGMVSHSIGAKQKQIDGEISGYQNKIDKYSHDIDTYKAQISAKLVELDQKQKDFDENQKNFDDLKNIDKKIKDMKDLRTKIEQEDELNHPASMYFLLKELKLILDKSEINEPDKFEEDLKEKWGKLDDARKAARHKKGEVDDLQAKLELANKKKTELEQKRKEKLLCQISQFNQKDTRPSTYGAPCEQTTSAESSGQAARLSEES